MKKNIIAFCILLVFSFLWTACKKDINTSSIRLIAIETWDGTRISMEYDNSDRITKLYHSGVNQPVTNLFDVTYNGNEIIMGRREETNAVISFDSVFLFVDANNMAQKRIKYTYLEVKPFTAQPPQKMFFHDTSFYEYDAAGLLQRKTCHRRDSNWVNMYGRISSEAWFINELTTYVNSNGNLSSYRETSEEIHFLHDYGTTSATSVSSIINYAFEYSKRYPNKTDFKNATVLNAVYSILRTPLNKNYHYLPDKYTLTQTMKDENGATSTSTFPGENKLTYNSYGFLASDGWDQKTNYIYNR